MNILKDLKAVFFEFNDKHSIDLVPWNYAYCLDLLDSVDVVNFEDCLNFRDFERVFLNGSSDWFSYSNDGNSLIFDEDIAARFMCPIYALDASFMSWLDRQACCLRDSVGTLWGLFVLYVLEKIQTVEV